MQMTETQLSQTIKGEIERNESILKPEEDLVAQLREMVAGT